MIDVAARQQLDVANTLQDLMHHQLDAMTKRGHKNIEILAGGRTVPRDCQCNSGRDLCCVRLTNTREVMIYNEDACSVIN